MSIKSILEGVPVVPVIVVDRLEQAVPLARALAEGGLPVLEVTLRTANAMQAVREISDALDNVTVGVGTLTQPAQFDQALEAGARFAVSPGLTAELIAASEHSDMPLLPGVFTPSEVMRARAAGFDLMKLFPASQAGGIGALKALAGPFPDVSFCPTGGIGADDFRDYLRLPNVVCVGGSWVCPPALVQAGDWSGITRLAAEACGGQG